MSADPLRQTLRDTYGFPDFRAGQRPVVERLLAGRSVLAIFPTGAGKSLCYQLTALHLPGLTVVVSPLIALMKDQIDFLRRHQVAAARVDSTQDARTWRETTAALRANQLKLLYVSPERLGNERFLATLRGLPLSLFVVDEAHCISEWGHNFRPDYLKLAGLAQSLQAGRVLALTATATPAVARDIARSFGVGPDDVVHTGFHRPNLFLRVTSVGSGEATGRLVARLRERPPGSAVVYVTLQKTAETVAADLARAGVDARPYHAGLDDDVRAGAQDWFMRGEAASPVIVATIAFGMGIDKSDLRAVYHLNFPKSLENYSQETGRAGRDGKPAHCELFACDDDLLTLENFVFGDTPEPGAVAAFCAELLGGDGHPAGDDPADDPGDGAGPAAAATEGETFDVAVLELSERFDVRPLVVGTLLTYLELEGAIASLGPFYREYAFLPQRPSAEILARFEGERAEFLRDVFRLARKGTRWLRLDLTEAATRLNTTRERLVRAFNYLEEQGDLQVKPTGLRQAYRRRRRFGPAEVAALAGELNRRFAAREQNDLGRLRQVVDFARGDGCLTRRLVGYFGEEMGDCGHCARCAGEPLEPGPDRRTSALPAALIRTQLDETLRELGTSRRGALASPRQRARFLCGLSSPRAIRERLTRHPRFGALAQVPFAAVLRAAEETAG